jgi:hypothetical protein
MVMARTRRFFFFGDFGDERVGGQQQGRDAGRVAQGRADDLGRVDHAGFHQIAVFVLVGVVAFVLALELADALTTTAPSTPALSAMARSGTSSTLLDDVGAEFLVALDVQLVERFRRAKQATPPPGTMPSSKAACVAAWRRRSTPSALSFPFRSWRPR